MNYYGYDYWNANSLSHHGIKGQKWGVRRFQNPDGSLTDAGKQREKFRRNIIRNRPMTDDINDIVRTLSKKEKKLLGASLHEDWIEKDYENEILLNKAFSFVEKKKQIPVSFIEIWTNGGNVGQIAIATRNESKYRNKGYSSKVVKEAIKWTERYGNKSIKELEWIAENTNSPSIALANKFGFTKDKIQKYENYTYFHRKNKNYKT